MSTLVGGGGASGGSRAACLAGAAARARAQLACARPALSERVCCWWPQVKRVASAQLPWPVAVVSGMATGALIYLCKSRMGYSEVRAPR